MTAVAALAIGMAGTISPAGSPKNPPRFVPDPPPEAATVVQDGTWTFRAAGYTVQLSPLDDLARRAFIKQKTGSGTDPFATRPDRPGGFPTFLVRLDNHGEGAVSLNPQNCWLLEGRIPRYPLDRPTIETSYAVLEQELPEAYRTATRALLDGEVVVVPGDRAEGLLVYRPLKNKAKRFSVELQVATPAGGVDRFRADYRRAKKK